MCYNISMNKISQIKKVCDKCITNEYVTFSRLEFVTDRWHNLVTTSNEYHYGSWKNCVILWLLYFVTISNKIVTVIDCHYKCGDFDTKRDLWPFIVTFQNLPHNGHNKNIETKILYI